MDKIMKRACAELKSGNTVEVYLPQLLNRMATVYSQYGELEFTMYYYSLFESYNNLKHELGTDADKELKELNSIIMEYISSKFSGNQLEHCIKSIDKVRNHIIDKMKILTSFTDILQIYEYVLNRIEYRFEENIEELVLEEEIQAIKQYIFSSDDNFQVNERMKEVIGQLPVRMTKAKFFDLIHDSFSLYKDSEYDSFDSYLYMIKTTAMLYKIEGMDTVFPRLKQLKDELERMDYKSISKEEYTNITGKLESEALYLSQISEFYYEFMQVINPFYAVILTNPYSYMDMSSVNVISVEEKNNLKSIVESINHYFSSPEIRDFPEELESKFFFLEGKQEHLLEELQQLEGVLFDTRELYENKIDSLMLQPIYNSLKASEKLLGNSLFVNLQEEDNQGIVDDTFLMKSEKEFLSSLSELMDASPKPVNRAIMAGILSKLPVFFRNSQEVMNFITYSFEQCKDLSEKTASLKLIKSFWMN